VTLRNIRALRPQNRCYIVMAAENILMDQRRTFVNVPGTQTAL